MITNNPTAGHGEQYMSLRKAAQTLGIHHTTLSRAVKRGQIKVSFVTPGGQMRFSADEVARFRNRHSVGTVDLPSGINGVTNRQSADLLPDTNIDEMLNNIPDLARRLINARYAAMGIMDEQGNVLRFITSGMSAEEISKLDHPPEGRGLLGAIFQEGRPIRIPNIAADHRSSGFPPGHPPMKSFLGVPITLRGENVGNLYFTDKIGAEEFSERDQELVELFAQCASSTVENAQLYVREAGMRRQAELARAEMDRLIESSSSGVMIVDAVKREIVFANTELARIMGVEFKQGDPWNPSESPVTIRRKNGAVSSFDELPLYHALVYGTTSRGVELWLEHPDGTKVPVLVNAAPVFDNAGRVTSAIAVFEDVTALQEVEQMKSDFLSMISHDLRGPLSTIKGLSSSLLMTNATADVDTLLEYISNIDEEADRMTELVSNLLDMSRIEARSMPLDYEVCHIADIARDCVSRVRRARDSELHPIVLDVPPDLPEMYCDYDQIGRVVSNLLSNAMKYSGDGTSITLRAYTGAQGQEVVVEVSDEGVGIPESELDRIFDKFYRVSSNISRQKPGSGLGLAICKSIVDAHGGRIAVESQPQQGSTFRFSIPVEPDALK